MHPVSPTSLSPRPVRGAPFRWRLEAACRDGRVRALKGQGPKKESLILKALEERKQHSGRHLLPDAAEAAALLLDHMREQCPTVTFTLV